MRPSRYYRFLRRCVFLVAGIITVPTVFMILAGSEAGIGRLHQHAPPQHKVNLIRSLRKAKLCWGADSPSADLITPKTRCCIHRSTPLNIIRSHMNRVHIHSHIIFWAHFKYCPAIFVRVVHVISSFYVFRLKSYGHFSPPTCVPTSSLSLIG